MINKLRGEFRRGFLTTSSFFTLLITSELFSRRQVRLVFLVLIASLFCPCGEGPDSSVPPLG